MSRVEVVKGKPAQYDLEGVLGLQRRERPGLVRKPGSVKSPIVTKEAIFHAFVSDPRSSVSTPTNLRGDWVSNDCFRDSPGITESSQPLGPI